MTHNKPSTWPIDPTLTAMETAMRGRQEEIWRKYPVVHGTFNSQRSTQ